MDGNRIVRSINRKNILSFGNEGVEVELQMLGLMIRRAECGNRAHRAQELPPEQTKQGTTVFCDLFSLFLLFRSAADFPGKGKVRTAPCFIPEIR